MDDLQVFRSVFRRFDFLVNFLIMNRSDTLSAIDLSGIETQFFDELKFAQWAVEELKLAKARGDQTTLADIVSRKAPIVGEKQARKRKPKEKQSIEEPIQPVT